MKKILIPLLIIFSLSLFSCNQSAKDTSPADDSKTKEMNFFQNNKMDFKPGLWQFITVKNDSNEHLFIIFDEEQKCVRAGDEAAEYTGIKLSYITVNYDFKTCKELAQNNPTSFDSDGNFDLQKGYSYLFYNLEDFDTETQISHFPPNWFQE